MCEFQNNYTNYETKFNSAFLNLRFPFFSVLVVGKEDFPWLN